MEKQAIELGVNWQFVRGPRFSKIEQTPTTQKKKKGVNSPNSISISARFVDIPHVKAFLAAPQNSRTIEKSIGI